MSTPKTERVIAYIDGFNLYFGLIEAELECYKWLNIKDLSRSLLRPNQALIHTKYYTSLIVKPDAKRMRQSNYLDALRTLGDLTIVYGKYERAKIIDCPSCRDPIVHQQEKMTDVNIAVGMMEDAYRDEFDTVLLISGDSDLCPPVRAIRRIFPEKRILVAFPPKRVSSELIRIAHATLHIKEPAVRKNQFPDSMVAAGGRKIERPSHETYRLPAAPARVVVRVPIALTIEAPHPIPKLPPGYTR